MLYRYFPQGSNACKNLIFGVDDFFAFGESSGESLKYHKSACVSIIYITYTPYSLERHSECCRELRFVCGYVVAYAHGKGRERNL